MLPRAVLPGSFYMITRRCTQRQFLLRPDEATNNSFVYCLGEAAQRFDIDVILPSAMSNHHHTVVFDRHGTINEFVQHFHKMFATITCTTVEETSLVLCLTKPKEVLDENE
jgi:hypothetical protein